MFQNGIFWCRWPSIECKLERSVVYGGNDLKKLAVCEEGGSSDAGLY